MKQKLNNALNELDERLIQEAAEADRLDSSAPKILRRVLIPAGVVAAAGLCVFALTNRPDGGVSLTASTPTSIPAADISGITALPEEIPLVSPTREQAEEFGTKAKILYADQDIAVFTDFSEVVYFIDLKSGMITYSADTGSAIDKAFGGSLYALMKNISYFCVENDAGEIQAAVTLEASENSSDSVTYLLYPEENILRRTDSGYKKTQQTEIAFGGDSVGGIDFCSNVLEIGGNNYIGMTKSYTAVKSYIVVQGIGEEPLNASALGEENPVCLVIYTLDENEHLTANVIFNVMNSLLSNLSSEVLPDVIELRAPSREYAEEVIFGSEFPYLIYADESRIVFTDIGRCVYIYDRNLEEITHSADVYEALKNTAGDNIKKFARDGWNGITFSAAADGTVVIAFTDSESEKYTYTLDESSGTLNRLTAEYDRYLPQRPDSVNNDDVYFLDTLQIGENQYVGISLDWVSENGYLRMVELSEFSLNGDKAELTSEKPAFTDEYFGSLEMADKNLAVYKCGDGIIRFDTKAMTFEWDMMPEMNSLPSGSYTISGDEVTLNISQTSAVYTFRITEDGLELITEKTYDVGGPEDSVVLDKIVFTKRYGADISTSEAAVEQEQSDEYAEIEKMEEEITRIILKHQQNQDIMGDEMTAQLRYTLLYPLDSNYQTITTHSGYDAWRGGIHYGIDIGGEDISGANIYAVQSGTVIKASSDNWNGGMGKYIIIDHGSGLATVYANCGELTVTEGQQVKQGDVIGLVGSTGWSTGPHLHFEIRENGENTGIEEQIYGLTDENNVKTADIT